MEKKHYRVELNDVKIGETYNSRSSRYGLKIDFKPYSHFLNTYLKVMKHNNISVDFLVLINNIIFDTGNLDTLRLQDAIVDNNFIDLYKITNSNNHIGQKLEIKYLNYFTQSFDEKNKFINFDNGTYLWETVLEIVRNNLFKENPSRLNSTFFFTEIDNCKYYINKHLEGLGNIYEVEILEAVEYFEGDMNFIDNVQNHILFEDLINKYADYWRGKQTGNPIPEIVFQGKFKYKYAV